MGKRIVWIVLSPLIVTSHFLAAFVVWLMETDIKFKRAWKETTLDNQITKDR